MSEWWTSVRGREVEQGDLLFALPVVRAHAVVDSETGGPEVHAEIDVLDVIIVTQTCDLQNARTGDVLLARVLSWQAFAAAQFEAGNTAVKSAGYIENLIRGNIPPLALLYERTRLPELPWSVVDFRELYTVSRDHLDTRIGQAGHRQRLRLVSPYKEHFAQAFARYFMRVGLPHDAVPFRAAAKQAVARLGVSRD